MSPNRNGLNKESPRTRDLPRGPHLALPHCDRSSPTAKGPDRSMKPVGTLLCAGLQLEPGGGNQGPAQGQISGVLHLLVAKRTWQQLLPKGHCPVAPESTDRELGDWGSLPSSSTDGGSLWSPAGPCSPSTSNNNPVQDHVCEALCSWVGFKPRTSGLKRAGSHSRSWKAQAGSSLRPCTMYLQGRKSTALYEPQGEQLLQHWPALHLLAGGCRQQGRMLAARPVSMGCLRGQSRVSLPPAHASSGPSLSPSC